MAIMRDETFGPAVGIMKVASDEEAVRLMNDSEFGLTAAIFSADAERAEMLGDALETGTVFLNRCDYLDPALAWTGVKNSGRGCTLSSVGLVLAPTILKKVVVARLSIWPDFSISTIVFSNVGCAGLLAIFSISTICCFIPSSIAG